MMRSGDQSVNGDIKIKDIFQLLAMILPLAGLLVFGWLNSPMLGQLNAQKKLNAATYLAATKWDSRYSILTTDRDDLMERWGLTLKRQDLIYLGILDKDEKIILPSGDWFK